MPDAQAVAVLREPPDRDVAVAVMVSVDGRYLLQLRDDRPELVMPGHWGLFGGSIEPGETPDQAVRRELLEELGFVVRAASVLAVSIHAIWPECPVQRLHFYLVPFEPDDLAAMVQTEGAGRGLFTIEQALRLDRIAPWDLCALLFHARRAQMFPHGQPMPR